MQISTVFQTSPWLAELLLSTLPIKESKFVIELGPGAGAITRPLLEMIQPDCKYLGIELNPSLVAYLKREFPNQEFQLGSAELCREATQKHGLADSIVSSLPWTIFDRDLQEKIIKNIIDSLNPGAGFATYVCVNASFYPAAKHFKNLLEENFTVVDRSRTEWKNMPPAFVYSCRK